MPRNDPTQNILDVEALGSYRAAVETFGCVPAQGFGTILYAFRWTDATRLCVLERLTINLNQNAAATNSFLAEIEVFIARNWTASDTGGVAVGTVPPKRTSMGASLIGDHRFSNAAAGLTAGTRTLDANPILRVEFNLINGGLLTGTFSGTFDASNGNIYPIVFAQNEGFEIINEVGFPAAGGEDMEVHLDYSEVNAF